MLLTDVTVDTVSIVHEKDATPQHYQHIRLFLQSVFERTELVRVSSNEKICIPPVFLKTFYKYSLESKIFPLWNLLKSPLRANIDKYSEYVRSFSHGKPETSSTLIHLEFLFQTISFSRAPLLFRSTNNNKCQQYVKYFINVMPWFRITDWNETCSNCMTIR